MRKAASRAFGVGRLVMDLSAPSLCGPETRNTLTPARPGADDKAKIVSVMSDDDCMAPALKGKALKLKHKLKETKPPEPIKARL